MNPYESVILGYLGKDVRLPVYGSKDALGLIDDLRRELTAAQPSAITTPSYRNIAIAAATKLRTIDRASGDEVMRLVKVADASADTTVNQGEIKWTKQAS